MITTKRLFLILLFVTLLATDGLSQKKVKYKNVFPLLQSKDYATAEPLLIQFLEENQDEANAFFYLGEIISSKLDTTLIFPSKERYDSLTEKAIDAYKKAIALVDEKEVRKNDDYYMAYNRRDLRTGKFGIKISDVHLDYENKISGIFSKQQLVHEIHSQGSEAKELLVSLNENIQKLAEKFPDEKAFYFQSTSEDHQLLEKIENEHTELEQLITIYVDKINSLSNANYKGTFQSIEMSEWSDLEILVLDFDESEFVVKDYSGYANQLMEKIKEEILPLKELTITTDNQIEQVLKSNQNIQDSSEISFANIPVQLKDNLIGFDVNSLPLRLLQYKLLKNEAQILSNTHLFPVLADSTNVYQRTNTFNTFRLKLVEMQNLFGLIEKSSNDRALSDYAFYLNKFQPSFEGYLATEKMVLQNKLNLVTEQYESMQIMSQNFIHEEDTIYLNRDLAIENNSQNEVMEVVEMDESLIITGQINSILFIANAGFDMKIQNYLELDSVNHFNKLILLKDNLILSLTEVVENEATNNQSVYYLKPNMEKIWTFQFKAESAVNSAKQEGGIFFLYNENGDVLKTLSSSGKEIGAR
ncbi:hypothetical protein JKA74_05475 [Marivirga sp. S37H4]|uniref:Uncharacterized protein n=1 Tax=Marivirga aurantiaca TaxID=2802615 RepID=A0A934WX45_9BACT|nr:hypothetical protein [Marivirga aurantiaca]MBK6264480.1 hypothetical protein [Marivirga aurantiaca]